jgi:hypothetical protein
MESGAGDAEVDGEWSEEGALGVITTPCMLNGIQSGTDQAMTVSPLEPHRKPAILRLDRGFQPCSAEPSDELYPNGIFEFNITRLLAFIHAHTERFRTEFVELVDIPDYGGSDRPR